jgi:hypothetical protein
VKLAAAIARTSLCYKFVCGLRIDSMVDIQLDLDSDSIVLAALTGLIK